MFTSVWALKIARKGKGTRRKDVKYDENSLKFSKGKEDSSYFA